MNEVLLLVCWSFVVWIFVGELCRDVVLRNGWNEVFDGFGF